MPMGFAPVSTVKLALAKSMKTDRKLVRAFTALVGE
jgi:hypothetical protein